MSLPLLWVMWQHITYMCVRCLPVHGGMRTAVRIPSCPS